MDFLNVVFKRAVNMLYFLFKSKKYTNIKEVLFLRGSQLF